jgi:hypothetical protein
MTDLPTVGFWADKDPSWVVRNPREAAPHQTIEARARFRFLLRPGYLALLDVLACGVSVNTEVLSWIGRTRHKKVSPRVTPWKKYSSIRFDSGRWRDSSSGTKMQCCRAAIPRLATMGHHHNSRSTNEADMGIWGLTMQLIWYRTVYAV